MPIAIIIIFFILIITYLYVGTCRETLKVGVGRFNQLKKIFHSYKSRDYTVLLRSSFAFTSYMTIFFGKIRAPGNLLGPGVS